MYINPHLTQMDTDPSHKTLSWRILLAVEGGGGLNCCPERGEKQEDDPKTILSGMQKIKTEGHATPFLGLSSVPHCEPHRPVNLI